MEYIEITFEYLGTGKIAIKHYTLENFDNKMSLKNNYFLCEVLSYFDICRLDVTNMMFYDDNLLVCSGPDIKVRVSWKYKKYNN